MRSESLEHCMARCSWRSDEHHSASDTQATKGIAMCAPSCASLNEPPLETQCLTVFPLHRASCRWMNHEEASESLGESGSRHPVRSGHSLVRVRLSERPCNLASAGSTSRPRGPVEGNSGNFV
eukprot:5551489-Amphidinium_carterae.3